MVCALILLVGACSTKDKPTAESHASSTVPTSAGTTSLPQGATPQPTAAGAVGTLLAAEQRGDHARSYNLLSSRGRAQYPALSKWEKRRSQVPPITSFTLGRTSRRAQSRVATVVAEVRHAPGLDPFVGLSAARERETWTARQEGSDWLADPDPSVDYELPPNAAAASSALRWARAVQACDKAAARALQAVDELYSNGSPAPPLCRAKGTVTTGRATRLQAGPSSSGLIAQYSTDVLAWARVVRVSAPSISFSVVLAPLGDMWKIVGLSD